MAQVLLQLLSYTQPNLATLHVEHNDQIHEGTVIGSGQESCTRTTPWLHTVAAENEAASRATAVAVPHLRLTELTHHFNSDAGTVTAIEGINLEIETGSFTSIIGESGCGKSTLFNILAGLIVPSEGTVEHDGRDITGRAGIVSYMLQKDLLLPWRTVIDNVIFGLELQDISRAEARAQALPYLDRYGLGGFALQYPGALSGGMRQRAALLRTLLCNKDLIMLDEPFAALDAQTRFRMQSWLLELWKDFGLTILFVTHDIDEAIFLSDEILVLSPRPGRLRERILVDEPRPRGQEFVTSSRFGELKAQCLKLLFEDNGEAKGDASCL